MTIERKREWANSSSNVVAPSTAKIDAGWDNGEQPPAPYENSERRENDRVLNNLVDYGPDPLHHKVSETDVARRYMRESWWDPSSRCNDLATQSSPGANSVPDVAYYNDPSTGKKYILGLVENASTNPFVYVWDPKLFETTTTPGSQIKRTSALTSSLPSPTGRWIPLAMCTDGAHVYITFQDSGAVTALRVQAYTISVSGSSEWSRRSGWPATGVGLVADIPFISQVIDVRRAAMAMCGNTDRIAVLNCQIKITSSSVAAVTIFNATDGSVHAQGAGGGVYGTNVRGAGSLAAESGFCVYGTFNESSLAGCLCAFRYVAPTTGIGGFFPQTNPIVDTLVTDVVFVTNSDTESETRYIAAWTDTAAFQLTSPPNIAATTRSYLAYYRFSTYYGKSDNTVSSYDVSGKVFGRLVFDGFRLWVVSLREDDYGTGEIVINTFDPGAFVWGSVPPETNRQGLIDLNPTVHTLGTIYGSISTVPSGHLRGCLAFDGDSIWVAVDPRAGESRSGRVYGLRRAAIRW